MTKKFLLLTAAALTLTILTSCQPSTLRQLNDALEHDLNQNYGGALNYGLAAFQASREIQSFRRH